MLALTRSYHGAIGKDHINLQEIVDGKAILSGEIPVPTTQRQSSDAGAADDTSWHVKAKGMRCVIDVALGVAWAAEKSKKMILLRKQRKNLHVLVMRMKGKTV